MNGKNSGFLRAAMLATAALGACAGSAPDSAENSRKNEMGAGKAFTCSSPISGGLTEVATRTAGLCLDCTSTDEGAAIDSDANSFATLAMNVASGTGYETELELLARAQPGVVYPGGMGGATLSFAEQIALDVHVYIVTYLQGVPQSSTLLLAETVAAVDPAQKMFVPVDTRTHFDAVGVRLVSGGITNADVGGERYRPSASHVIVRVHEFCSAAEPVAQ